VLTVLALVYVTLIDAKSVNIDDAAISKDENSFAHPVATGAESKGSSSVTTAVLEGTAITAHQADTDVSAPATNVSPSNGSHDGDVGRDKRYYFYPTWGRRFYWRNRLKLSPWWSSWWDTWDGWYDVDVWNRYNWAGLDWWDDFYSYGGRFYRSASNETTQNHDGAKEDGAKDIKKKDKPPADATSTSTSSSSSHNENASRGKRHILYPTWGRRFYWRNRLRLSPWWSSWWDTWSGWYDADVWNHYNWAGLGWWDDFYLYGGRFYRCASNATTENQGDGPMEDGANDLENKDETPADATSTSVSSGSRDGNANRDKRNIIYPTWGQRFYWRNRLRLSPWWSRWWDTWNGWYDVDVWDCYDWAGLDWWDDFFLYGRFYRSASNVTTENQDNGAKEDGAIDIRNVDGPPADATPTSVSSSDSHDENASREKRHILYPTWGRRFYWRNRLRLSPWWSSWWDTWNGWYDVDVWNRYSWASLDWWDDFYLYGGRFYRSASNATTESQDIGAKDGAKNIKNKDEPPADVTFTSVSSSNSHDENASREKRHILYPTWGRRFYWRKRLRLSPWWSSWWDTWNGWYDADVWNHYNWAGLDWWDDFYQYGGRFYRSASNVTTENQDNRAKEDDGALDIKNKDEPAADATSTDASSSSSHDENAGRDKRYYIIYPTWDRRFYWRNRLKNSRWWNNWWDTWDGWSNVGVWDAYDWSSLYWWNDFYYGGRYYRSATDGVGFQLIAEAKSWSDAAKFCAMKRMCLATLTTKEERDATASVSSEVSYWIGGRYDDSHAPVSWRWINGQPITDVTWKDIDSAADIDSVAGVTRPRCLVAEVDESAGEWSHADCGDVKPFLCQTRC